MADARHAELDQALQLSTQMLQAARAGNWDGVPALQTECDALLRRDLPNDDATRGILRALQQQHRELLELTERARDATGQQLGLHRRNHRALNAYLGSGEPR